MQTFMLLLWNMLNAKYFIIHPQLPPVQNYSACGHAWFVKDYG